MKIFLPKSAIFTFVFLIGNLFFANVCFGQATVMTDKNDYAPGSTAIINGSGFQAGEVVELHVEHVDGDPLGTDPEFHEPWFVTADNTGNFNTFWYVPTEVEGDAYGATLLLTAHGSLGSVADWLFTDAGNFIYSTTPGKSSTISTIANTTNSTTLSVDVTAPKNNGTFNASLVFIVQSGTTIGIGNGVNQINLASVINDYITGGPSGSEITKTFAITVAVGSNVPDGTYQFQATAISTSGFPGNNKEWKFDVIVGSIPGAIGTVTVGTQSGISFYGSASSPTFDVTSLRGANGLVNGTYSVSGLPSGVTFSFAPLSTFIANGTTAFPGATLTLNVPPSLNAGLYNFTVSLSDGISTVTAVGTLNVTKAPLTVLAVDQNKEYGLLYTYMGTEFTTTGLVNTDSVTSATISSAGSAATATVGTYDILISSAVGSGLSNYDITYTNKTLTVGKRFITITADSKSKYCGQVDPALTYTITSGSLVFDHTFTGSLMRSEGESAGSSFAISMGSLVLSNNALSDNYAITFIEANLSIQSVDIDASTCNVTAALGTSVTLKATVSSPVIPGVSLAGIPVFYKLDNGSGGITDYSGLTDSNGVVTVAVSGLAVEVYSVTVTAGADCASGRGYLAVYDPSGGFVTGGGWINSPAGAYTTSPTLSGKANFGFVAKYKKGSTQVDGNTEFQFQTGNLNFSSSSHDAMSLVIAGAQAIYKGKGTINGLAGYSFMVSAIDGDKKGTGVSDKFRIKIWNTVNGSIVYDNQIGQADNAEASTILGGGSIVIHEAKKNISKSVEVAAKASVTTLEIPQFKVTAYPNPSKDYFSLDLIGGSVEKVEIDIFDMQGRKIKHIESASQQSIVFGEELPLGNYIVVVNQGANRKIIKLLKE